MIFRTSRPRSAWSCEINMFWDTGQAITSMTPGGAKSRSNCAHPRAFRLFPFTPGPVTTRLRTELRLIPRSIFFAGLALSLTLLFFAGPSRAQIPVQTPPPPPPPDQDAGKGQTGSRIKLNVSLVVLHTTVVDDRGKFVEGLAQDSFRVYEDKVEQKLSLYKREDIPVSMGLVIDNSGSMRDKRPSVNEAALTLVHNSNPELKEALERIYARGSTALYDAIIGSLDHLKKGKKEKKVLLIVTDGEDNTSRNSLEKTIREIQKTDTVIYTIGLLSQESKRSAKNAKKALTEIALASGGVAFFPENVGDVHNICEQVAHDIRHQYTLGYYPLNVARDGSFRSVHVDVIPPRGKGKLVARTRNGYYAPLAAASTATGK